jgi:hypothetical protein
MRGDSFGVYVLAAKAERNLPLGRKDGQDGFNGRDPAVVEGAELGQGED